MFSKACEYGIKSAIYIALQSTQGHRTSLKDISKEINSPEAFTAKILQQLAKNKIVDSSKGPAGGFWIEPQNINKIKLSQIVYALDGDNIYNGCGLGLKECSADRPCPLHDKFSSIRDELKAMLQNTTLFELAGGLEVGLTCLKL